MLVPRRILSSVAQDLTKKMVFVAGPRQCGKTTLAKQIVGQQNGAYYSWDIDEDRKNILNKQLDFSKQLWALDELHKNRRWRNWLKGVFDQHRDQHSILVTGSARLDLFSKGGDSLQGRYYMHRLHPFSLSEITGKSIGEDWKWPEEFETEPAKAILEDLSKLGGFPEPFLSGSDKEATRWRLSYGSRLVREEIRDLERVDDLSRMELLFDHLPQHVGSPLSINSLREDIEVAHGTLRNWLTIFDRLYGTFRVSPFGPSKLKAVKKEQKLYFWDWAYVENSASRFENLVAMHLLRLVHWLEDVEGKKVELRYFRTTVGHEVDFVLIQKGKPIAAIEVKLDDRPLDKNLKYLLERVKIPRAFQISLKGTKKYKPEKINGCDIWILPAYDFLSRLP